MNLTKSDLPEPSRRLIELFQQVNFGRIEGLRIENGVPTLPPRKVLRQIKFGGDNGPRPEHRLEDFQLGGKTTEFFASLAELGDGLIEVLEIQAGLPFRMTLNTSV